MVMPCHQALSTVTSEINKRARVRLPEAVIAGPNVTSGMLAPLLPLLPAKGT